MESISGPNKVSFAVLQARLILFLKLRIRNGDFTERGLARILAISQSQLHNVLKGARRLSPDFADHLLCKFDMSVLDLLEVGELTEQACSRETRFTKQGASAPAAHLPVIKLEDLRKP